MNQKTSPSKAPAADPRIIGAIDIGTNSVLLTVARSEGHTLTVIDQHATVTRLGQGVDQTGKLHADAIKRTLECLRNYRTIMDRHGVSSAHAVGTSAMRDAEGGSGFVGQLETVLRFRPEVISGLREAELTFRGALSGLAHRGSTFVFDIGGGSTELIVGTASEEATIQSSTSLNIGSVRLTERCKPADPPSEENLNALRTEVSKALENSSIVVPKGATAVGVAGTVTTLAAIAERMTAYEPSLIHGYTLTRPVVSQLVAQLASLTTEERKTLPGLTPGRADVIVAGSILCEALMKHASAEELIVSDRGVRFGLLAELAAHTSAPPSFR